MNSTNPTADAATTMPATKTTSTMSPLARFTFPRTGKRGVPQQFPRRLYEMLEKETRSVEASADYPNVISWSDTGKAFRIYDVAAFSVSILPRYFRTKKVSSFQRNLNLYGFTKIRRGPDSDMYAHPSFLRERPELLLHLRKVSSNVGSRSQRRFDASAITTKQPALPPAGEPPSTSSPQPPVSQAPKLRPVSPSTAGGGAGCCSCSYNHSPSSPSERSPVSVDQVVITSIPSWDQEAHRQQQQHHHPQAITPHHPATAKAVLPRPDDRGKLDLLALALEKHCS